MKHRSFIIAVFLTLALVVPIHAQVVFDGTIGPAGNTALPGPDYDIRAEQGHQVETNLFHSFQQFSIGVNETATFRGPSFIENIVSRVTGGDISHIDGILRSTISGADLYFLNPAGVMFGPTADLDISGSLHISTADYLNMGGNERFYAIPQESEVLSSAAPTAFGFLDNTIEPITFDGCDIGFAGETFSVIGGDIRINNTDITNEKGRLNLASVASPGEVRLVESENIEDDDVDVSSFAKLGHITISGNEVDERSQIYVRQDSIFIRGERFVVDNSKIISDIPFSVETRPTSVLDIQADTVELKNDAYFSTDTFGNTDGPSLNIRASESVDISESEIRIGSVETMASGDAGRLSIEAKNVTLSNTEIRSESKEGSTGKAGDVDIAASESVTLSDSVINSYTTGMGKAGTVEIGADIVTFKGGTKIQAYTLGKGQAGEIFLTARDSLTLEENASVNTETEHEGKAGEIELTAPRIQFRDTASVSSSSKSEYQSGEAGTITVKESGSVSLQGQTSIVTETEGPARAGDIFILNVGNLQLDDGALISSASGKFDDEDTDTVDSDEVFGDAGTITVTANDSVRLFDSSSVKTEAQTSGGGKISVNAENSLHIRGGVITTSVSRGTDKGGDINIGDKDTRAGPAFVILDHAKVIAKADEGDGGAIFVITDNYLKSADSEVDASSRRGNDGTIEIEAPDTDVSGSLTVLSSKFTDISRWMKTPCEERLAEDTSRFVMTARDGIPSSPDDWLPSSLSVVSRQLSVVGGVREAINRGRWAEMIGLLEGYPDADDGSLIVGKAVLLSHAYSALGHYRKALALLHKALPSDNNGQQTTDNRQIALLFSTLGDIHLSIGNRREAIRYVKKGLDAARSAENPLITACVLNNLGNVRAVGGDYEGAVKAYRECLALSDGFENAVSPRTEALTNLARIEYEKGKKRKFFAAAERALSEIGRLPDDYRKAANLISLMLLTEDPPYEDLHEDLRGFENLAGLTVRIGEKIQNDWLLSYAYGCLGQHHEETEQYADAVKLTRRAIFSAQQGYFPEILYRWQWQLGRLFARQGDTERAVKSYRDAVATLNPIRTEFFTGHRSRESQFEENVRPVYIGLAELLLKHAENDRIGLTDAGETMETLKKAELEDFFQDECLTRSERKFGETERIPSGAAVIYPILFPDHLTLLLMLPDGMRQIGVPVTSEELGRTAAGFREQLEDMEEDFQDDAEQLYDWLIRPAEDELVSRKTGTLVIAPDGPLRLIPFAALHDGERFLTEKYALGYVPAISLTEIGLPGQKSGRTLLGGLSEEREDFPALKGVEKELEAIRTVTGGKVLLNQEFTDENLESEMRGRDYGTLHLATHAIFGGSPEETYLVTYNDRLTMDELGRLVGLRKYQERQPELLTLSACETAMGDERSAFGLAGVALKAGARSAVATLWSVSDKAAFLIVDEFYRQLGTSGVSKAEALRNAQKRLIAEPRYEHPAFWAPFLLIGNWL